MNSKLLSFFKSCFVHITDLLQTLIVVNVAHDLQIINMTKVITKRVLLSNAYKLVVLGVLLCC